MKVYFVVGGKSSYEDEVIAKVQPENILISYWYWQRKDLESWIDKIGYRPKILLDSGAWTAYSSGSIIGLMEYAEYIRDNAHLLDGFLNLDVIGDPRATYENYRFLGAEVYDPIPVYHYGDPIGLLEKYHPSTEGGRIALGNTVGVKDKRKVQRWVNALTIRYPKTKFHLLGSTAQAIFRGCPGLYSVDASTWFMRAVMGTPSYIPTKIARAEYNMRKIIEDAGQVKHEQIELMNPFDIEVENTSGEFEWDESECDEYYGVDY